MKNKEDNSENIANIISLQHPVVLIWFISTLLFIFTGYIYSSFILN